MDDPEIKIAPDAKFRTSHYYQPGRMRQKLLVEESPGEVYTKTKWSETTGSFSFSLSFCIWGDSNQGLPCFQMIHSLRGQCPSLPTSVTSQNQSAGSLSGDSRNVPPASTEVTDVCTCTASALGPCCPNTLHTAEPGCSALTADIKHRLPGLETVLLKEKGLENRVSDYSLPGEILEFSVEFKLFLSHE